MGRQNNQRIGAEGAAIGWRKKRPLTEGVKAPCR